MINYKDLALIEITLRKYENIKLINDSKSRRELLRKLCLSIGLINPRDKNDILVDIFYILLNSAKQKRLIRFNEIKKRVINFRKKMRLTNEGCSEPNMRKQLKKLKDFQIIESINTYYRIIEFMPLSMLFKERIMPYIIQPTIKSIEDYFRKIDELFLIQK